MHARTIILAAIGLAFSTGCKQDPSWSDLQCWETVHGTACIGSVDGETVRVAAPSVFNAAVAEGRYTELPDHPACSIDPLIDSTTCYEPMVAPGKVVCVADYSGVYIPSMDPCDDPPDWPYSDAFGLYAWPDHADNFAGMVSVPWPG